MTTAAKDMRPGKLYRRTVNPGGFWYERPPAGTARRLTRRLLPRTAKLNSCDREALRAARADLDNSGVLAVRHLRGVDPLTRERFELRDYVLLPLDAVLREVRKKPGYEERMT